MALPTPNNRYEKYLNAIATGNADDLPDPITREETYLAFIAQNGGGSGGSKDYSDLSNKPSVNGVELNGDKSAADLGITYANMPDKPRINNVELVGNKTASALKLNVIYEDQSIVSNGVSLTIYNT